jgi:uncharacterized cupin superfamily protein
MPNPPAFDPMSLAESNATLMPAPLRAKNQMRWSRRLGAAAGLTNFGVNLTRIVPGGQSSYRHAHTLQDEFVWVLEGRPTLVSDAGEQLLEPGLCAAFPKGTGDGHHFVNRTETDVLLLVVGDRTPGDEVLYPDDDLHGRPTAEGGYVFTHKDGSPW